MSNVVEQINDALETQISAVLPTHSELDHKINIQLNFKNSRSNKDRFGVRPLDAVVSPGVTRVYTVDHNFEVALTREYVNRDGSDLNQRTVTFQLYDDMSTIIKRVHLNKAGLPSVILLVNISDMLEPEYIEEDNIAILRAVFVVKYREAITG